MSKTALAVAVMVALLATPVCADLFSNYAVKGRASDGSTYEGKVEIKPVGQIYQLDFCCDKSTGFAVEHQDFLAAAYSFDNGNGDLNIWKRDGDDWVGVFSDYSDGGLGGEVMYNKNKDTTVALDANRGRSRKPVGKYRISGTNPNGSTYTGEVEIGAWADAFDVSRTIGDVRWSGTGVTFDGAIAINVTVGDDLPRQAVGVVGLFVPEGNGFVGVWAKKGSDRMGAERWVRK
jgi:hypothetical protein